MVQGSGPWRVLGQHFDLTRNENACLIREPSAAAVGVVVVAVAPFGYVASASCANDLETG